MECSVRMGEPTIDESIIECADSWGWGGVLLNKYLYEKGNMVLGYMHHFERRRNKGTHYCETKHHTIATLCYSVL